MVQTTINKLQEESTFHYGSIKIIYYLCNDFVLSKSTFHYGSIKMAVMLHSSLA